MGVGAAGDDARRELEVEMGEVGSGGGGEEERAGPLTERSCEMLRLLRSLLVEGLRLRGDVARSELESWCLRSARGAASEPAAEGESLVEPVSLAPAVTRMGTEEVLVVSLESARVAGEMMRW